MTSTAKTFSVEVKPRKALVAFVSFWTLGCVAMTCILIWGLATSLSNYEELYLVLLVLLSAVLLASNYIRWQLTGRENLIISDNSVRVFRSGTFFSRELVLKFNELDKVGFDKDNETPSVIKLYGIGGGKLKLEYLGRLRRFGQDLSLVEAEKLSNDISAEIKKRNNYPNTNNEK